MNRHCVRTHSRALALGRLFILSLLLYAAPTLGADLGPHGGLAFGDAQGCRACHLGYPSDTGIGERGQLAVPPGGQVRLGEAVARFCWLCHRPGNPYGATAVQGRVFAGSSHASWSEMNAIPDSWAVGAMLREIPRTSNLFSAAVLLTCTTCHDPHDHAAPLFLRNTTPAGDYSLLCDSCHTGRTNRGLAGRENIIVRAKQPYSTHPTDIPVSDAPGSGASGFSPKPAGSGPTVTCGTCHDVHAPADVEDLVPGLLRLQTGEHASDMCRRCHLTLFQGGPATHPMEGGGSSAAYPGSFASTEGIPREWKAPAHFNAGATGFSPIRKQSPRCTSCHDLHGGLPMTSLLYAPNPVDGGSGDWCSSCHPGKAVLPPAHEQRAPGATGRNCVDCHGSADASGARAWRVHRDFRAVLRSGETSAQQPPATADVAGGPVERERQAVVAQLVHALRDDRPFARENAAQALVKLQSPLALDGAIEALGDPRADVREKGARILGTINDERAVSQLLGQLAAADPGVRRSAVEALGRIGGESAQLPLIPLLRDPALEVRRAAVTAFEGVRDPRVYPALVEVLWGPDSELSTLVQGLLGRLNDARLLSCLLEEDNRRRIPVLAYLAVINRFSDPAGTPELIEALRIDHRLVRMAVVSAMRRFPDQVVVEALAATLDNPDLRMRTAAVESLGALRATRTAGALLAILASHDEAPGVRIAAIAALELIAPPAAIAAFIEALGDPAAAVKGAANGALVRLTCQNFGQEQGLWREWWGRQGESFPLGACR